MIFGKANSSNIGSILVGQSSSGVAAKDLVYSNSGTWNKAGGTNYPQGIAVSTTEILLYGIFNTSGLTSGRYYFMDTVGDLTIRPCYWKVGFALSSTKLFVQIEKIDCSTYLTELPLYAHMVAGASGASYYADNDQFNDNSNSWTAKTDLTASRRLSTGFAITSNYGFCVAGQNSSNTPVTNNYRFSQSGNSWSAQTSISNPARYYQESMKIENYGFNLDGMQTGSVKIQNNDRFDNNANSWAARTDGPETLSNLASFSMIGYGFKALGVASVFILDCDRFDDTANSWSARTDAPLPKRRFAKGASINNYGFVIQGEDDSTTLLTDNDRFNDTANSWASKTSISAPARFLAGITEIGTNYAVVCGGQIVGSRIQDNDRYSESGDSWSARSDMTAPARYPAAAFSI